MNGFELLREWLDASGKSLKNASTQPVVNIKDFTTQYTKLINYVIIRGI